MRRALLASVCTLALLCRRAEAQYAPMQPPAATPYSVPALGPVIVVPAAVGTAGTSTTNSADAQNIINALNAAALANAPATIFIPDGQYIVNNFGYIPANTTVQCAPNAIISADAGANWNGTGGITSSAFQINVVDRTRITGCSFIWPSTNNTPHIIQINGAATHVMIDNNYSTGGGDFVANIGGQHVTVVYNDGENVANGFCDNWNGFVDVKCDFNTASSNAGSNSGVGLFQATAISIHGTAALAFSNFEAIGNVIDDENSGSGQVFEVNGYTGATTPVADGQNCVIADNIINVGLTNALANPWGVLVSKGGCTNINIHDNIFNGNPAIPPSHSVISVQDTLTTLAYIEHNKANNWQAANVNGDFANAAVYGTNVGNICTSCAGSLIVDGAGILSYGGDSGTGTFSIPSPVSITSLSLGTLAFTSGSGTFTGNAVVTNAGSLSVAAPAQFTGTFGSNQGPKWGTDTQGGIVEIMDSAASQAEITRYQIASVDAWRSGMDTSGNFSITDWASGSVVCTLFYGVNSTSNLTLGCTGDTLTLRGSQVQLPGYVSAADFGTDGSGNLKTNPSSSIIANPLKATSGTNWYLSAWDTVSNKCTLTAPTGTIEDYPVYVNDTSLKITKFGIETTIAGTASVIDVGIRADSGNNSPGTLLIDAGTISTTTAGNLTTSAFTTQTLSKGEYWIEVEQVNIGTTSAVAYCETQLAGNAPVARSFVNTNVLGGSNPSVVIGAPENVGESCSITGTGTLTGAACSGGSYTLNSTTPLPTVAWLAVGVTQ